MDDFKSRWKGLDRRDRRRLRRLAAAGETDNERANAAFVAEVCRRRLRRWWDIPAAIIAIVAVAFVSDRTLGTDFVSIVLVMFVGLLIGAQVWQRRNWKKALAKSGEVVRRGGQDTGPIKTPPKEALDGDLKARWKQLGWRERWRLYRRAGLGETDDDPEKAALIAWSSRRELRQWWQIPLFLVVVLAAVLVLGSLFPAASEELWLFFLAAISGSIGSIWRLSRLRAALARSEEVLRRYRERT